METEIRVYLADMAMKYPKDLGTTAPIEEVIECAEQQGNVMTLPTFIDLFNKGELPLTETTIIRMAEFYTDQYEFTREI